MKRLSLQALIGLILFLLGCTQQPQPTIMPTPQSPTNTFTASPTETQTPTPTPTLTLLPSLTFTPTYVVSPNSLFLSDMKPYIKPENVYGDLALDRVFWQPGIVIDGKRYEKGLGMHPPETGVAFVGYRVPKGYTQFLALAGLAWEDKNPGCKSAGDARFRVFVNNELKFDSNVIHFGPPTPIQIPVKEGDILRLEVDKGIDNYDCDHATWADARFEP